MSYLKFDRTGLKIKKLEERINQLSISTCMVPLSYEPVSLSFNDRQLIKETAVKIRKARKNGKSAILAFGAHTIKNGLSLILIELIKRGWITHLATNGAGIIHDWEFAFQGKSGEDVRRNVDSGEFGIWEETGFYINLALIVGAREGLGYGESVGKMIAEEGLLIPDASLLLKEIGEKAESDPGYSAASLDLFGVIRENKLKPGFMGIPHSWKEYSVQSAAYSMKVPFTGHPMIGHDIIYNHPINNGAAVGRTALVDFLYFAGSVSNLDHGVYISLGSAVMSPMIFEKSLSMAQNIEIQHHGHINGHFILVVDLAKTEWNWKEDGEPPVTNPAYYLRYCKTFHRMGGDMNYLCADNRDFLAGLLHELEQQSNS
jgi:hypothetical protein